MVCGEIESCELVRLRCQYHLDLLDDVRSGKVKEYRYNESGLSNILEFSKHARHYKGALIGEPFDALLWEKFWWGQVYGWERFDDDHGVWTYKHFYNYLFVPKKNGKTFINGTSALYDAGCVEETGAEVYCIATKEAQAKLTYNDSVAFVKSSETYGEMFTVVGNHIYVNGSDRTSFVTPLGKDTKGQSSDGKNPIRVKVDELHAHENDAMYTTMDKSFSARINGGMDIITTAGFDIFSFAKRKHDEFVAAVKAPEANPDVNALIYAPDPGDEDLWNTEKLWRKLNPSYGVAKQRSYFEKEMRKIARQPSELNSFLCKDLNFWVGGTQTWLDARKLGELFIEYDIGKLKGKRCFLGVDLARKRDLSAVVAVFPVQDGIDIPIVYAKFFIDEGTAAKKAEEHKVPYDQWRKEGYVAFTKGNETNFEEIENYIETFADAYDVETVWYDPTFGQMMFQNLRGKDINAQEFRQTGTYYTDVIDNFEKAFEAGKVRFVKNPCLEWNLYNVEIVKFSDGHIMPFKKGDENKKIDGACAALMGWRGMVVKTEEAKKDAVAAYLAAKGYVKNAAGEWVKPEDEKNDQNSKN